MIGIYKIENPNGRVYIGQSVNIEARWDRYFKNPEEIKNQTKVYNSISKYGIEHHKFTILEECRVGELNRLERKYQEEYKAVEKGLNCKYTTTESKTGYLSEETRSRISKANLGKKVSLETRRKLSESLTGKKKPPTAEQKRLESRKGYKHTKETLNKIRLSNKSVAPVTCPHCRKVGKPHGMKRWHFDSCREKLT